MRTGRMILYRKANVFLTVLALLDAMDKETPNLVFVFEEGSLSLVTLLVSFSSYFVKFVFGYLAFHY